jgi:16S rRNA (adenine1518-N6/adenine1519-N6)-dimethyltransferase
MGRNRDFRKVSFTIATSLCMLVPCNPLVALSLSISSGSIPRCQTKSSFLEERYRNNILRRNTATELLGWVQQGGEWEWIEDGLSLVEAGKGLNSKTGKKVGNGVVRSGASKSVVIPKLPSRSFRPNQSLGQNFMNDANTIQKIVKAFEKDAIEDLDSKTSKESMEQQAAPTDEQVCIRAVELGPGTGALTGPLIAAFGIDNLQCIEIDARCTQILHEAYPALRVKQMDAIYVDYHALEKQEGGPLSVIGNIPYVITTQILFSLVDASHTGSVRSATVTMQWEVARRIVAPMNCKDYGILTIVFQLYADCVLHFKIPRTVFYPQPKVDSALVGLRFIGPKKLRERLCGVTPLQLRRVLSCVFQQRRKTLRNSLKSLVLELCLGDTEAAQTILRSKPLSLPASVIEASKQGDEVALHQELPLNWHALRPEQLSPGHFIEVARLVYTLSKELSKEDFGNESYEVEPLGLKVWGKIKHGS